MILEPKHSAEEIERRLSALSDPDLTELLREANPDLFGSDPEPYASTSAPYWKRRVGLLAIAGLLAMSVGFGYQSGAKRYVPPVVAPPRHQAKAPVRHSVAKHHAAPVHHAALLTVPRHFIAPVRHLAAPAPDEALIRQARAQLIHQRQLALQAEAQAALARRQAQARAHAQEVAQARAQALEQALVQARAEALAQARAQAIAQQQAESAQAEREQEWVVQNASGSGTKAGIVPPSDSHGMSTYPSPNSPAPGPGPIDPNCTPHRGSLFRTALTGAVLGHVRLGGTNVGNLLRLVNP